MTQVALHDHHPAHRHLRMLGADLVFQTPVRRRAGPQDRHDAGLQRRRRAAAAAGRAGRRLAGGLQGHRQAVPRALQAAAVRPRRLRVGGAAQPGADHAVLDRRRRGDLPDARQHQDAGPAARAALRPGHADVPVARAARRWSRCRASGSSSSASRSRPTSYGAGAADDPMLVFNLTDQVRETIQHTLYRLLDAAPVRLLLSARPAARPVQRARRRRDPERTAVAACWSAGGERGTGTHRLTLGSALDDGSGTALVTAPTGSVTSGLLVGSGATDTVGSADGSSRGWSELELVAPPVRPPTTPPTSPPPDVPPVLPPVAVPPPTVPPVTPPTVSRTPPTGAAAPPAAAALVASSRRLTAHAVTVGRERGRGQGCPAGHGGGLRVELSQLVGQLPGQRPQARVEQRPAGPGAARAGRARSGRAGSSAPRRRSPR